MEKLSINKAEPKASPLERYLGQCVVLQLGPVTYTGILSATEQHWMVLTNASITGSRHVPEVVEVWVHHRAFNRIAHIHLEADLLALEVLA